jgi:hypothetical protein
MMHFTQLLGISLFVLSNISSPHSGHQTVHAEPNPSGPEIKFDTTKRTCDTITEGMVYDFVYHYENTGSDSLILFNVKSSCGCYVPRWSRKPLALGERDSIVGRYNSRGRPGHFTKSMTVISNSISNPRVILYCKGYTQKRDED